MSEPPGLTPTIHKAIRYIISDGSRHFWPWSPLGMVYRFMMSRGPLRRR
jgi:hypothetical protein